MRKTYFYLVVVIACTIFTTQLKSQQSIYCNKIIENDNTNLNARFRTYQLFNISSNIVNKSVSHTNKSLSNLKLTFPGFMNLDLSLVADNILSDNYTLVVDNGLQKTTSTINDCITYTGKLYNDVNSVVAFTITDDFFYGMIRTLNKEYYIEPLHYFKVGANVNTYVIYEKSDVIIDLNQRCAVVDAQQTASLLRPTAGTGCLITEIAIASDVSMVTRYGTAAAVQTHNIGVWNNVKVDYLNNAFNDNIEFKIVTQNVSTSAAADQTTPLYAGTNSNIILNNFADWAFGNGSTGGFGLLSSFDIGQIWTTRNIDADGAGGNAGIIGLAYVGVVCNNNGKFQLIEDFAGVIPTGSGFNLRVVVSHETGHNFNMSHDGAGTSFIMAPSVQNTSTWSPASITSANTFISGLSGTCRNTCIIGTPVTDFTVSSKTACTGSTVTFTDFTYGGPTTWSWTFQDGTPATSTSRNPTVTFSTTGVKVISLTATNANGAVLKSKTILVEAAPVIACAITGTSAINGGIRNFALEGITNSTVLPPSQSNIVYIDYSCSKIANLSTNTAYTINVSLGDGVSIGNGFELYIDYNNDGDFLDINESVFLSAASNLNGNFGIPFTTPSTGVTLNKLLRMRVIGRANGQGTTSCPSAVAMSGGEVEDYSISFPLILPLGDITFKGILNNNKNAYLQWNIQNSLNYQKVALERSEDGSQFRNIYQTNINGNNYNFTDPLSINGSAYYRLKITYLNGNNFYSNIVKLSSNNKLRFVQNVMPNPFTNTIQFNVYNDFAKKLSVQIYDNTGRKVHAENTNVNAGIQLFEINNLEKLTKGMYMLVIQNGKETYTEKLIKQ